MNWQLAPSWRHRAAVSCAHHSSPCPTTNSSKASVAMPAAVRTWGRARRHSHLKSRAGGNAAVPRGRLPLRLLTPAATTAAPSANLSSRQIRPRLQPLMWTSASWATPGFAPDPPIRQLPAASNLAQQPAPLASSQHPPMEMACSMALRLAMSSSRRATKVLSSLPGPSSASAHSTCFFCGTPADGTNRVGQLSREAGNNQYPAAVSTAKEGPGPVRAPPAAPAATPARISGAGTNARTSAAPPPSPTPPPPPTPTPLGVPAAL